MQEVTIEVLTKMVVDVMEEMGLLGNLVPTGISARHVHLTREHIDLLFGKGYQLTALKPLSQPGQFAANETVNLVGPKGSIQKVRVLGPERSQSQVEVAQSDARRLGITAPVRSSGKLAGSPGILLQTPAGEVKLNQGVIIPDRHIHMTPADAARFGVKDGEKVSVSVSGEKGGRMENVTIRVSEQYALDFHIDTDDANAFLIRQGQMARVKKADT